MAINMALGILFLSRGTMALSNSIESIAMLICSLFYQFPLGESDNKSHLQALRHFAALAAESRFFSCVDVESKKECMVRHYYSIC
jgi:anaphase-promoting complex subunit 1